METATIIGLIAAVLTTIANIPQAYKIIRQRSTEGVSAATYFILLSGVAIWTVYGILRDDWPVIIANGISTLVCIIILSLYFASQKNVDKVHEAVLPEKVQREAIQEKND
jgi:MtN3 and saliva related transmembrane protein